MAAIDKWSSKPRLLSSLVKVKVNNTFRLCLTAILKSETSRYRAF